MTEAEWLSSRQLEPMFAQLHEGYLRRSLRGWLCGDRQRKLRLFVCAHWRLEGVHTYEAVVEVAERYADGQVGLTELLAARRLARDIWQRWRPWLRYGLGEPYARLATSPWPISPRAVFRLTGSDFLRLVGLEMQSLRLFHELFHPYRSGRPRPAWVTSEVRELARGIEADQAYDRLGILGDALEEAGCEDDLLLRHCRRPGDHVRGCWAVDVVLGKQ